MGLLAGVWKGNLKQIIFKLPEGKTNPFIRRENK